MGATDGRKRGTHARLTWWRRRRATAKLVLLEYPDQSGQAGKPIEMAAPARHVERRGSRRVIAIAAGLVVATGAIAGGSIAFASGGGSATAVRTSAPDRVVMPDKGPIWTGLASGPALRSAAAVQASPSPSVSPAPAATTAAPSPTAAAPAISVVYRVDDRSFNGFDAEIDVTNSGAGAVSGWAIVVALPQDRFESWSGASGDASDGALILQPQSSSGPLEPGQTLRVHFKATGMETTPTACAFNDISCATS